MESGRKEKMEQRAVLLLLGVFAVVLVSSLKGIGFFNRKPQHSQAFEDMPDTVQNLPEAIQRRSTEAQEQLLNEALRGPAVGSAVSQKENIRMPVLGYSADPTRNPLMPAFREFVEPVVEMTEDVVAYEALEEVSEPQVALGLPPVTVQGIIWGGRNPQVIIDEQVYQVGDLIGRGRIVAIDRDGVAVNVLGATFRTGMRQSSRRASADGWESVQFPRTTTPVLETPLEAGRSTVAEVSARDSTLREGDR